MLNHLKNNISIYLYIVIAVILELTTNVIIYRTPFIYNPWLALTFLSIICLIMSLIKKGVVRYYIASTFIIIQGIINLACTILYDMTGTLFDFSMFTLRNDAMSILEKIPMNFTYLYIFTLVSSLYLIFVKDLSKKEAHSNNKVKTIVTSISLVAIIITNAYLTISINDVNIDYKDRLYTEGDNYLSYGATSNFINEMYKGLVFNDINHITSSKIDSFIYESTNDETEYFGISKDNNLVTILVESFEWFSFIQDLENYPNGLNNLTEENIEYLFPNLTNFYDNSVVMTNNYAREKTDISENLSLIGSYPSDVYINYAYPDNTIAYSLPSILEALNDEIQTASFHNNYESFYNRYNYIPNVGFDAFYGVEDMLELNEDENNPTITHYSINGEANLDSEMIETCKDIMFPTDTKFYTYITTLTMHGMYTERENLTRWYEKMDSINVLEKSLDETDMKNDFRNYVAAVMEFDHALGLIMEDLTNKGLLENTTIVLFGDHNAYYEGLTNYVKNIYSNNHENYTNLFRTPLMIYDKNLTPREITKFTTIYDIVPTILDLFGINYYNNIYYGNPIFGNNESIIYSRAYDVFLTDKIYFSNLSRITYKDKTVDDEYLDMIENKALQILEKIDYVTNIFYEDYFGNSENYNKYINNLKSINSD